MTSDYIFFSSSLYPAADNMNCTQYKIKKPYKNRLTECIGIFFLLLMMLLNTNCEKKIFYDDIVLKYSE